MQPRTRRIIPKTTAFFIQSLLQVFWGDEKPTALNHHPAKVVYAWHYSRRLFCCQAISFGIFGIDIIDKNMNAKTWEVVCTRRAVMLSMSLSGNFSRFN